MSPLASLNSLHLTLLSLSSSLLVPEPQTPEAGWSLKQRLRGEGVREARRRCGPRFVSISAGHDGHQKTETLPEDPASVCLHQ